MAWLGQSAAQSLSLPFPLIWLKILDAGHSLQYERKT